jgi:hypothetical protein
MRRGEGRKAGGCPRGGCEGRGAYGGCGPKAVEEILRDPDDNYLVALAREAGAEAIVSGDGDLLDHAGLAPPALSAREACQLLELI